MTEWFNDDWDYRKEITIDSVNVDSDLSDWPLLVNVTDNDLADKAQGGGDDILFVDGDNSTQLSHEIESYDSSTGELWAHVRLPSVSASEDTGLYVYYGNSDANNQESVADVWTNNYGGVWHLNNTEDSSPANNDGTAVNGATVGNVDSPVGNGTELGGSESVEIPYDNEFEIGSNDEFSYSMWVQTNSSSSALFSLAYNDSPHRGIDLWINSSSGSVGPHIINDWSGNALKMATDESDSDFIPINNGEWHHVFVTYDGGTEPESVSVYIDGFDHPLSTENDSLENSSPITETDWLSRFHGRSDGDKNVSSQAGDGIFTEGRFVETARSDGWILATYANQNDPQSFYTVGEEEDKETVEVSGTVLFRGEPAEGAVVYIFNTESEEVAATTTDGSGEFSLGVGEASFLAVDINWGEAVWDDNLWDDDKLSQNLQATAEFEKGEKYRQVSWDANSWDFFGWGELVENDDVEIFTDLSKSKIVDNE